MLGLKRINKRLLIILAGILCLMAVGYAAFSSNLQISGTSSITSSWNIEITDVSAASVTGSAEEVKTPTWTGLSASMEADLYEEGDSVSYKVTIANKGNLDASLEDITENIKSSNDAVRIMFTGYTKGGILKANSTQVVTVKIEYNPEFTGEAATGSGEVTVTFNYKQYEGSSSSSDSTVPQGKYLVKYDCETNGGRETPSILHNQYLSSGSAIDLTPQCEKAGYTFIGWNTNKDATTKLNSSSVSSSDVTLYGLYKKDVTVKFYKNNASTQDNSSDEFITKSCTMYNTSKTCNITSPTIVGSDNTPTVVGYNTSSSATTSSWNHNTSNAVSANAIYYAITSKSARTIKITFIKNTADKQTNSSGTAVSDTSVTRTCTIAATYNGTAQDTICKVTSPKITAKTGYTVIGYGTAASATESIWNQDVSKEVSADAKYYAITLDKTAPTIDATYTGGIMYTDPTFASGANSTNTYNNSANGTVTKERVSMTTPVGSYALKITTAGTATPGLGGFYFASPSAADREFVTRIIAKIPTGYTIAWASNKIGQDTKGTNSWLTSQKGTGDWEEYVFRVKCGSSGTFSTTNFFYINGTAATSDSPVTWYVAYATVYSDQTYNSSAGVSFKASDSGSGITQYGINQSSTTEPTYTDVTSTSSLGRTLVNITSNGTYYVWVKDAAGNKNKKAVTVSNIDKTAPTNVSLSANSDSTYATSKSVTVTVKDTGGAGLAASSFKYGWSTSTSTAPSSYTTVSTSATTGTNSTTFTATGSGLTGSYYLWVVPTSYKDNAGNTNSTTVKSTGTFKFDNTNPTLTLSTSSTTNNITAVATASAASGITKYEFSKDGGSTWVTGTSNTYTFTGLSHNTTYSIKARVTSGVGKQTTSDAVSASTSKIDTPTYTVEDLIESNKTNVTITYPSGCGNGITCSYSKDGGTNWTEVSGNTTLEFTSNSTLIAKVTDGTNTINGSTLTISIKAKIGYTMNGGTNYTGAPTSYAYGVGATINGTPTYSGYTFNGWTLGNTTAFSQTISKTDTGNKTVSAKWCKNCASVSNGSCKLTATTAGTCTYTTSCNTGYTISNSGTYNPTCTANTYTIGYTMNGGTKGSSAPTSATYGNDVNISNPTKTFIVNITDNNSATLSSKTASKAQTFTGWTASGLDTSTAKTGTSASPATAWSGSKTTNTYFKNLRSTSGTVTMTANWTAVGVTLPTVTKSGYTCSFNTASDGSGTSYASGGVYTPSTTTSSTTLYTKCTSNTAVVTINKDSSAWISSNISVALYQSGTSKYSSSSITNSSISWNNVVAGTYDIYATKSSLDSSLVDTGVNITVSSTGTSAINYYTLTLNKGAHISTVSGAGTYLSNQTASISATAESGYSFSQWQVNSGNTPSDVTEASTTVSMSKKTILTALTYDSKAPSCSISTTSDLKATSQTATLSCTDNEAVTSYYFGTSSSPTSSDYASNSSTSLNTTKSITAAGTYYLFAKDSKGNVSSATSITYNTYTVNNMLLTLTGTKATYNTTNYEQKSSNTYIVPKSTSISIASVYTNPYTGYTTYKGYSTGNAPSSLSTADVTLSSNSTYYTWFDRNEYTVTLNKGTGISAVSGAGTYRYDKSVTIGATVSAGYTWSKWTNSSGASVSTTNEYEFNISNNVTYYANALDETAPTDVSLSANSDSTYSKTKSVTVTVKDTGSGLAASSFKYGWSTSTSTAPSSYTTVSTSATTGTNSTTFTATGSGLTGSYYLWVVPVSYKDNAGNTNSTTVKSTGTFKFDNSVPTITMSPSSQSTYVSGGKAVTLTIADTGSGLKASQTVNYAWSTSSSTVPTSWSSLTTSNTAGATSTTVTVPASASSSLTGTYYLWIKAGTISDVVGHTSAQKVSSAFKFDNNAPSVTLSTSSTTNSITVVATASAASGITKYEFSKDGGSTWVTGTSKTYTFTGLSHNTTYSIKARITSGVGVLKNSASSNISTKVINSPTFSESLNETSKSVTVSYPSGCGSTYTCTYSKDGATAVTVTSNPTIITFTSSGNLVATVTDGTNTVSSSYTVTVPLFFVSSSGSDTNGNGSHDNPFATIDRAVEVATDNNIDEYTIYLLSDIIMENGVNFTESDKNITITSYGDDNKYTITRKDSKAFTMFDISDCEVTLNNIIIEAMENDRIYTMMYPMMSVGEGVTLNITGDTEIKNATCFSAMIQGCAISSTSNGEQTTINIISANIHNNTMAVSITNAGYDGGAIAIMNNVVLNIGHSVSTGNYDVEIHNNNTHGSTSGSDAPDGGAISATNNAKINIRNNVYIHDNYAQRYGGAIDVHGSGGSIIVGANGNNIKISGNYTYDSYGGGISVRDTSTAIIHRAYYFGDNTSMVNNASSGYGHDLYCESTTTCNYNIDNIGTDNINGVKNVTNHFVTSG